MKPRDDTSEQEYVLGTDAAELRRLGFQHQVWAATTARLWELARFAPGQRVLDLGCGPGYATADLAPLVGADGQVVAVDVSRRFLASLEQMVAARGLQNVQWHEQDAAALDLPAESLHGAFARWVLCFTPDPASVIAGVHRALAPGGRFAVLDYANYEAFSMAPASAAVDRVIAATGQSVRKHGGDMSVGRNLPHLMHEAGFEVTHIEPIVRVARPGEALWEWPATFFANYLPALLEMQLITVAERDAFDATWAARTADPSAYLVTPTMVGVIGVKR
jgi:ubiquinone/menaquinone biosynthesis C-methylase UbiE